MKVCILGAGAYGLALALSFYKNNNEITVWTKVESEKDEILSTRQNKKTLPNVYIPEEIKITTDLNCVTSAELIVLAIPVTFFRNTCLELKNYVNENQHFCIATKGIENNTNDFCHEIFKSIIPNNNLAILSGPTFAIDLANNSPSGLTLASSSPRTINLIKQSLTNKDLTIEESKDIIGTEICGSIKNIMAIIAGILDGINATETTKSLFMTKALKEIKTIITSLNGNPETAYSLCGIGDLILTCTSTKSRNFTLGTILANNKSAAQKFIAENTVEGYYTLTSMYSILKEKSIESPLIECLYKIIFENKNEKELLTVLTCE